MWSCELARPLDASVRYQVEAAAVQHAIVLSAKSLYELIANAPGDELGCTS